MLQRPDAGRLVEHIKGATKHALALGVQPRVCAYLLTEAGVYISVALSQFTEAKVVLLRAMTALNALEQESSGGSAAAAAPPSPPALPPPAAAAAIGLTLQKAKTLHHLGMVSRYLGDYTKSEVCLLQAQDIRSSCVRPMTHR